MAVYTLVTDEALTAFLAEYTIGDALSFKGIAEGVENSNYFLETSQGRFILTLFEKRANPEDLPYFVALKKHLSSSGFPCPEPVVAQDGIALRQLAGKHALIVTFLDGLSPKRPNVKQCHQIGAALANMHLALSDFELERPNALGPSAWPRLWAGRADIANALQRDLAKDIDQDLAYVKEARPYSAGLPRGTIHADLFPDNTFFLGDRFCGAFDFYFACTDVLAYDLAVCLNAWAFEDHSEFNYSKGSALIAGYETVRSLTDSEIEALPSLCRGAALRFFLTRLVDWTSTPKDAVVKPHNPLDYAARLSFHRTVKSALDYGAK